MSNDESTDGYFEAVGDMAGLVLDALSTEDSAMPLVLRPMVERADPAELAQALHAVLTVAEMVVQAETEARAKEGETTPGPALTSLVALSRGAADAGRSSG